jgi:hypothetical protein
VLISGHNRIAGVAGSAPARDRVDYIGLSGIMLLDKARLELRDVLNLRQRTTSVLMGWLD